MSKATETVGDPIGGCPICGRRQDEPYRPFCSKRCADIDLSRWLGEVYRLPAEDDDEDGIPVGAEGSERVAQGEV